MVTSLHSPKYRACARISPNQMSKQERLRCKLVTWKKHCGAEKIASSAGIDGTTSSLYAIERQGAENASNLSAACPSPNVWYPFKLGDVAGIWLLEFYIPRQKRRADVSI